MEEVESLTERLAWSPLSFIITEREMRKDDQLFVCLKQEHNTGTAAQSEGWATFPLKDTMKVAQPPGMKLVQGKGCG